MHRRIRQESNALDPQLRQNLPAQSNSAQNAAPSAPASLRGSAVRDAESAAPSAPRAPQRALLPRRDRTPPAASVDLESARSVVQVKHHAATGFGNHAHRLVENLAAAAIGAQTHRPPCSAYAPSPARDAGSTDGLRRAAGPGTLPIHAGHCRHSRLDLGPACNAGQSAQRSPRTSAMWLSPPFTSLS